MQLKGQKGKKQLSELYNCGRWAREVEGLLRAAKARAAKAQGSANRPAIRDYFIVHLALSTGLRVSEMANLRCGDIFVEGMRETGFQPSGNLSGRGQEERRTKSEGRAVLSI